MRVHDFKPIATAAILAILACTFRGSAMVAQLAVNELVVGSSPTRGAKIIRHARDGSSS